MVTLSEDNQGYAAEDSCLVISNPCFAGDARPSAIITLDQREF